MFTPGSSLAPKTSVRAGAGRVRGSRLRFPTRVGRPVGWKRGALRGDELVPGRGSRDAAVREQARQDQPEGAGTHPANAAQGAAGERRRRLRRGTGRRGARWPGRACRRAGAGRGWSRPRRGARRSRAALARRGHARRPYAHGARAARRCGSAARGPAADGLHNLGERWFGGAALSEGIDPLCLFLGWAMVSIEANATAGRSPLFGKPACVGVSRST